MNVLLLSLFQMKYTKCTEESIFVLILIVYRIIEGFGLEET